ASPSILFAAVNNGTKLSGRVESLRVAEPSERRVKKPDASARESTKAVGAGDAPSLTRRASKPRSFESRGGVEEVDLSLAVLAGDFHPQVFGSRPQLFLAVRAHRVESLQAKL